MKARNVFIVEDKTARAEELRDKCNAAELGKCRFEITGDKGNAREKLRSYAVDIAFVDLDLNPSSSEAGSGKLDGLDVIAQIRSKNDNAIVVAYSSEFGRVLDLAVMVPRQREAYDACIQLGAHLIFATAQLLNTSPAQLGRQLNELIAGRTSHALENVIPEDGIGTRAAREVLDDEVIREAVVAMLGPQGFHRYRCLGSGFTSSVVLWVDSATSRDGAPTSAVILKFFRDEEEFLRELAGLPAMGTNLDAYSTKIEVPDGRDIAGWRVARSRALVGAVDLVHWLGHKRRNERRALDELCEFTLRADEAFEFAPKIDVERGLLLSRPMNFRFAAKVQSLLDRASDVRPIVPKRLRPEGSSLLSLICDVADGKRSLFNQKTKMVPQHGDAHGRNIFVGDQGNIHLIDFGRGMKLPRYFDAATLIVDLWLGQCAVAGAIEYSWDNALETYERALNTWPYRSVSHPASGGGIRERLACRVSDSVRTRGGDVAAREFLEVLGLSLLRYSTFDNLAIPRRLLAIRMAEVAFAEVGTISL